MIVTEKCFNQKYKLIPPDGGWGYLIVFSAIIVMVFGIAPVTTLVMIFGPFMSLSNDEISATNMLVSLSGALYHSSGLITNVLLQKFSFRKVAFIGTVLYCSSSFATIFVTDLQFLIICFSLQGIGAGTMLPSTFTAVNEYFVDQKMFIISTIHAVVGFILMFYPLIVDSLLTCYGFRGTQALLAAFGFHALLGSLVLHPVKWHLKKIKISEDFSDFSELSLEKKSVNSKNYDNMELESEDLIKQCPREEDFPIVGKAFSKSNISIVSIGSAVSYAEMRKNKTRTSLCSNIDFSILKEVNYLVIVIALSFSVVSEIDMLAILPVILFEKGYDREGVTIMMTTFFAADLIAKITISIVTAFKKLRYREIYLTNALLTVIIRTVFCETHSYWWSLTICGMLGFSRSCIHVISLLILTESYSNKFATAYSLNMVFNGISSLFIGLLVGYVRKVSENGSLVMYTFTVIQLVCVLPLLLQMILQYVKSIRRTEKQNNNE